MAQAQIMARLCRSARIGRSATLQRLQGFATAAPESDLVFDTFKEQQQQYQALLDGSKNITAPLTGDEAAIKKYAQEMEALRKKVGLPDHAEALEAQLEYELQSSGDIRGFLAAAAESQDLGEFSGIIGEVEQALEGLDLKSAKGWDTLDKKIGEIQAKHKLDSYDKIKDKAIYDMYKSQLERLRAKVVEDMEVVKRRDHLEFVEVDPATLKAKPLL